MIQQIGFKRVIVLVILFGALCVGGFMSYFVFGPKVEESQRTLSGVRGEADTLRSETEKMRAEYAVFEKQKETFDRLTRLGFFNNQDRLLARERFDTIRTLSKVISARYEINAVSIVPSTIEGLAESGFVLIKTPVSLDIDALDDLDVYRFLYYLTYGFPGHVSISKIVIDRSVSVTPEVLKQIGTGAPPPIIKASIDLEWITLTRKDSMESRNTSPVTNAAPAIAGQVSP